MADITLDKSRTSLLIADFYADMMSTLSHATERKVVEKTQAPCSGPGTLKSATGTRPSASARPPASQQSATR